MITLPTAYGPFLTFPTGTVTRALQSRGNWDEHVGEVLATAPRGGLALDLGAHIGWFSVQLAWQHDVVIAVEPNPAALQAIYTNLGVDAVLVQVWPVAAYSHPVLLVPAPLSDVTDPGSTSYLQGIWSAETHLVGLALDPYLPQGLPLTVIKCDCQGADLRALKGLEANIRKDRPLIVFEWEEAMAAPHGDDWSGVEGFFDSLQYRVERISPSFWDYVARPK